MLEFSQRPQMVTRFYKNLMRFSVSEGKQHNVAHVMMLMSGMVLEVAMAFDDTPDEAVCALLEKLSARLEAKPRLGPVAAHALPPASMIDQESEKGRMIVRDALAEWEECPFDFYDMILSFTHDIFLSWQEEGFHKDEMLRLFSEICYRALAYEIAAQELTDLLIERKAIPLRWDLNSCIAGLSALAGQKLASSNELKGGFSGAALEEDLDQIIYTMTQEAVRLGVPAGSNWRFGLAANDVDISAPYDLIDTLDPVCGRFFEVIQLSSHEDQAIACAKAAGRLLAVVAGGELPEIEPAIAKPLAVAAMSDTYKSICMGKLQTAL